MCILFAVSVLDLMYFAASFRKMYGSDDEAEKNLVELQRLLNESEIKQIHSNGFILTEEYLEQLLDRSELYEEMAKKAEEAAKEEE